MSILNTIGNTPLVFLKTLSKDAGANIYVKMEMFNPGGSVKDRASYAYIKQALARGDLLPGGTVIEASSGNLGIGLALVCKQFDLKLKVCMPESASLERRKLIKGFGAKLLLSPASLGMKGALSMADDLMAQSKNAFRPNQFTNPDGPRVHYENTGPEIVKAANKRGIHIDAFIAGVGSGATFTGTGRYLKELFPRVYLCPVEPTESAVLSGKEPAPHGIQGIGAGFIPEVMDTTLISEVLQASTTDAINTAQLLLETEGINAGISTGANVFAALMLAGRPEFAGKNIITIASDLGERYMSTALFQE